jgi:enoyl-CoA hydratase/carnithine racemase
VIPVAAWSRLRAVAEVETSRDGAVLTITLNRPDSYNAFTVSMHAALREALAEAGADDVRAVVVTGAGRGFCAGQDVTEFGGSTATSASTSRRRTTRTSARSGHSRSR